MKKSKRLLVPQIKNLILELEMMKEGLSASDLYPYRYSEMFISEDGIERDLDQTRENYIENSDFKRNILNDLPSNFKSFVEDEKVEKTDNFRFSTVFNLNDVTIGEEEDYYP